MRRLYLAYLPVLVLSRIPLANAHGSEELFLSRDHEGRLSNLTWDCTLV
jgi:hypothetical protein